MTPSALHRLVLGALHQTERVEIMEPISAVEIVELGENIPAAKDRRLMVAKAVIKKETIVSISKEKVRPGLRTGAHFREKRKV